MGLKLKCVVSHGVGWNGGVREYQGDITVNLNENEVKNVYDELGPDLQVCSFDKLENDFPDIYDKIERATFDFKVYTFVLDTCIHWSDEYGDAREKNLIEEDIQSGKFVPLYENAEGASRDPLIMNQWFVWMVESLNDLSYHERTEYLVKRYKMELPPFDELEFESTYSLV